MIAESLTGLHDRSKTSGMILVVAHVSVASIQGMLAAEFVLSYIPAILGF